MELIKFVLSRDIYLDIIDSNGTTIIYNLIKFNKIDILKLVINIESSQFEDLEATLSSIGYQDLEINQAIKAIAAEQSKIKDPDDLLRSSLIWLSKKAA